MKKLQKHFMPLIAKPALSLTLTILMTVWQTDCHAGVTTDKTDLKLATELAAEQGIAPAATAAPAGAETQAATRPRPSSNSNISIDEAQATLGDNKTKGQTLRCWQHGQLILERPAKSAAKEGAKKTVTLDGKEAALQLFDLKNATCLLQ